MEKSEKTEALMDVSLSFTLWDMKSERGKTETHKSFRHKSTSHISTLTQNNGQTVFPSQKHSDCGPTAGSTVKASTPKESTLLALDFNSLHLKGWLTAEGE